jgi:hypothetical protein
MSAVGDEARLCQGRPRGTFAPLSSRPGGVRRPGAKGYEVQAVKPLEGQNPAAAFTILISSFSAAPVAASQPARWHKRPGAGRMGRGGRG